MTPFRVAVHIVPRRGILDPQGKAVADALHALGFASVGDVHVGKHIVLDLTADSKDDAQRQVREMCNRLLANPVTEDYELASIAAIHAEAHA
jgi:phosphoribosylformylglycinamidine synthase